MFLERVVAAFFAGGALIGLLGLLAERAPRSLRGIIVAFPSTIVVSFFFLALNEGAASLLPALPGLYYAMIGALLFSLCYSIVAQYVASRDLRPFAAVSVVMFVASGAWLLCALLASALPRRLPLAAVTLLLGIFLLQRVFVAYSNRYPTSNAPPIVGRRELLFRALFSGLVVAGAVLAARLLGPFWGVVIGGSFPASFGSILMIFHYKYSAEYLPSLIWTMPIGLCSTMTYGWVCATFSPSHGIFGASVLALVASLVVTLVVRTFALERLERAKATT